MERKATNYAVTRKQRRAIVQNYMKECGLRNINKVYHYIQMRPGLKHGIPKTEPSEFSKRWREYWNKYVQEEF